MARTILEIYEDIIKEKETHSTLLGLAPSHENADNFLKDLTSDSKVAVWRLWAFLMSIAIHTHEILMDIFRKEVDAIAAAAPAGTPKWYQKKMLEFQFGDPLVYINNHYVYNPVDLTKQIIKRCAIEERSNGVVVVKLAKENNGVPEPLSTPERDAANSYAHKIKFAGTRLAVISIPADQITLKYDVFYDPVIPLEKAIENCEMMVNEYLSNLPFNAALNITHFTDALQKAEGVLDPVFRSAKNKPDGGDEIDFDVEIIPAAGWFVLEDEIKNMFNFIQKL